MFTDEVKKSIDECVLCWLATSNKQGEPNCSPKEIFVARGESELIIANIASPTSVANIQENEKVCVSLVHIFKQKGFKLTGRAKYYHSQDARFASLFSHISPLVGDAFPVKGVILVKVQSAKPIVAPGYYLVPGTDEASQIKNAQTTYGCTLKGLR